MQYLFAIVGIFVVVALIAIGFNTDILVKNTEQICNELTRIADALENRNCQE